MGSEAFVAVADDADVREGELLEARIEGQPIILTRIAGLVYAMGAICTHKRANLAEGVLEGERVICPLHGSEFDFRTGRALTPPATEPEPVYDVKLESGRVLVARRTVSGG